MTDATQPNDAEDEWRTHAFDLMRGVAAYTGSPLLRGISKVIARHPQADVGNAFYLRNFHQMTVGVLAILFEQLVIRF